MTGRALKKLPRHERPHKLDVLGAALMVMRDGRAAAGANWGGTRYPWALAADRRPACRLVGALWRCSPGASARAASRSSRSTILRNRVVAARDRRRCFAIGTMIGLTIYMPVYFEMVLGLSASASGLALIPFMGGTVIGSTIAGRLMAQLTHYKRVPVVGTAVRDRRAPAVALAAGAARRSRRSALLMFAAPASAPCFPVTTVSVQNAVLPWQLGTATGAHNFSRQLGGAIIVAVFGAIVLQGVGVAGGEGTDLLARAGARPELRQAFSWLFAAGVVGLVLGYVFLVQMEGTDAARPAVERKPAGRRRHRLPTGE